MSPNIDHENVSWSATYAGKLRTSSFWLYIQTAGKLWRQIWIHSENLLWNGTVGWKIRGKLDFPVGVESRMHSRPWSQTFHSVFIRMCPRQRELLPREISFHLILKKEKWCKALSAVGPKCKKSRPKMAGFKIDLNHQLLVIV